VIENLNIAVSGMLAQQDRITAVAQDLTNVDTTGYKQTRQGFRDLVYNELGRAQAGGVTGGSGVMMESAGRSFQQGAIERTDQPLDVALQGEGFLQVRLPDGRTGLTRDGSLRLDAAGQLMTPSGALVQPAIKVPVGTALDDVSIAPDGTVEAAGKRLGRLAIVTVRAPQQLTDAGSNAFVATAASGAITRAPAATVVSQGALEGSNVDAAEEMVEMIDAQRSFQLASKAISTADEMWQIANGIRR
jgi:flagellar basal-body rod protein FlgG